MVCLQARLKCGARPLGLDPKSESSARRQKFTGGRRGARRAAGARDVKSVKLQETGFIEIAHEITTLSVSRARVRSHARFARMIGD
jgi:hypothetical protein